MYRLLVVDNEKYIVENLLNLFGSQTQMDIEVYGAYSSEQALAVMGRVKIDIVLSDICMPVMTGLELQQEAIQQWPWCKFIFLTGYNDFEYIHQAMRNDGVDYLLKTEGEEAIVKAVEKAAKQLSEILEVKNLIQKAKKDISIATPILQRDYLWEVVSGNAGQRKLLPAKFEELQIPLVPTEPVIALVARVDDWGDGLEHMDRDLMLFAVQNITEELLGKLAACATLTFEKSKLLLLIQPKGIENPAVSSIDLWKRTLRFVKGTLETIQMTCKKILNLSLSVAVSDSQKDWPEVPGQFYRLKLMLSKGLGMGQELILIDQDSEETLDSGGYTYEIRYQLEKLSSMAIFLENGNRHEFFTEYALLMKTITKAARLAENLKLEIYYSLVSLFLSYMNRWGVMEKTEEKIDLGKLTKYNFHVSWDEVIDYFYELADFLFHQKQNSLYHQENDLIRRIQWFVEQNLAGDLSLTNIGDVVGLNPYYLSRLYKKVTNIGLADYVSNMRLVKAQELLGQNRLAVRDIAKAVGFSSEQAFYRFFKKMTTMTPQKFGESLSRSKSDNP